MKQLLERVWDGLRTGATQRARVRFRPQVEALECRQVPTTLLAFPGFDGANGLSFNGTARIEGDRLRLTDGNTFQAGSSFTINPVDVTQFSTSFTFQLTNPGADGITFTLQGGSPAALGPAGGGMGYGPSVTGGTGGIDRSVAVKFDLFNNEGEGVNSTGLYTNGQAPTVPAIALDGTGLTLHSGNPFAVRMLYDGSTLRVRITDGVTGATASQSYPVNIPAIVGGNTAFVGFTASTGAFTATQDILSWNYSTGGLPGNDSLPPPPPATADRLDVRVVRVGRKAAVVVDGKTVAVFDAIRNLTLSGDGRHFAFVGVTVGPNQHVKMTAVVDGVQRRTFDHIADLRLSADGSHFAFVGISIGSNGRISARMTAVIDGRDQRTFDRIFNLRMSDDGRHVAFVGISIGPNQRFTMTAVVDGRDQRTFDQIADLQLSADGRAFAFVGISIGPNQQFTMTAVVNGRDVRTFDQITDLRMSADGARTAFVGITIRQFANSLTVVLDGRNVSTLDSVLGLAFRPDGKLVVEGAVGRTRVTQTF